MDDDMSLSSMDNHHRGDDREVREKNATRGAATRDCSGRSKSSLQVSTITAVGKAGGDIDIVRLFHGVSLSDIDDTNTEEEQEVVPTVSVTRAEMFRNGLHHVRWKRKGEECALSSKTRIKARHWAPLLDRHHPSLLRESCLQRPPQQRPVALAPFPAPSIQGVIPSAAPVDDDQQQQQQQQQRVKGGGGGGGNAGASFGNQVTLVLRCVRPHAERGEAKHTASGRRRSASLSPYNNVNAKVFNNGGIQMTGAKTVDQGERVLSFVVHLAQAVARRSCHDHPPSGAPSSPPLPPPRGGERELTPHGYRVCLINSDFRLGFEIRRDRLHGLLVRRYPHLNASYDPCSYPGVVIRYKWKAGRPPEVPEGACSCDVEATRGGGGGSVRRCCNGKGDGYAAEGACRSITVIMFASGNAIITGARSYVQLGEVYDYVCGILLRHRKSIERVPVAPPAEEKKEEGEREDGKETTGAGGARDNNTTTTTTMKKKKNKNKKKKKNRAMAEGAPEGRQQTEEASSLLLGKKQRCDGNKNLLSFLSKARVRTVPVEHLISPPTSHLSGPVRPTNR